MIKLLRRIFHDNHPIDGCGVKPTRPKPRHYSVTYRNIIVSLNEDDSKLLDKLTSNRSQYISYLVKTHLTKTLGEP